MFRNKLKNFTFSCLCLSFSTIQLTHADQNWVIDSQEDWKISKLSSSALEIKKGMVDPNSENSSFKSILKKFPKKQSIQSITFDQSPVWQNWEPIANIGPSNLADAPVLLTKGPDDYWMFGRYGGGKKKKGKNQKTASTEKVFTAEPATLKGFDIPLKTTPYSNQYDAAGAEQPNLGGYHAWQSKDMINWVHHGAVTEGFSRWVTTAEYVDGKAYIYYDYPNDQDPHLYIDDNLTDGKPGKNMGMAFKDPSHGSDCSFIRDEHGKFHVIYEDWSPIEAKKRSWDSPLAGHAVSNDGMKDFQILKPAIDNRTTPTGEIKTYLHPHWLAHPDWDTNVAEYEVHSPEQEAYGDWASISIGGRYYLFGDFDPVGGHEMSVGWFTSASINEPFEWCDNIGKGHPDPDVCFAEGKFYLATQQSTDFVSDGPWVEQVTTRVGVDTNNDGEINQWSSWQVVKESYDYIPGFSKQIKKTNATLALNELPEGYAFQFEFKLLDTTENKSKPTIDKVTLNFQ